VEGRRFVSVALIRQVFPSRAFPGAVPCGVRTFLDASRRSAPRPPGQPEDKGMIPSMKRRVNHETIQDQGFHKAAGFVKNNPDSRRSLYKEQGRRGGRKEFLGCTSNPILPSYFVKFLHDG